jgi:PIN domain nuclease of toxin-antitoxin system
MRAVVADTHAAAWYLLDSPKLSPRALEHMSGAADAGEIVFVSSISVVELLYLYEKGRIPAGDWKTLNEGLVAEDSGVRVVPLTLGIAHDLARVPWRSVPDMPDRIIAATALHLGLPLVSRDGRIQAPGLEVIW